ncbi:hypothetical protein ACWD4J_40060 [Streptomyces sp. NPDC002577]
MAAEQIQALESEPAAKLFDRTRRKLSLTNDEVAEGEPDLPGLSDVRVR